MKAAALHFGINELKKQQRNAVEAMLCSRNAFVLFLHDKSLM